MRTLVQIAKWVSMLVAIVSCTGAVVILGRVMLIMLSTGEYWTFNKIEAAQIMAKYGIVEALPYAIVGLVCLYIYHRMDEQLLRIRMSAMKWH